MPTPPVADLEDDWDLTELTARQKTVRNLAYTVFGLIVAITLGILGDWLLGPRLLPDAQKVLISGADPKALLESYDAINRIALSRAKDMFDLMIVKALLPIFATIIGVLIGRKLDET
jgi:hypothetical protein